VDCKQPFTAKRSDALTCKPCRRIRRDSYQEIKGERSFICAHCGSEFLARRSDATYCSAPCSKRAYYQANREVLILKSIEWTRGNPDRRRNIIALRKARKRGNRDSTGVLVADWQRLVRRHGGRCAYCGVKGETLQADHVVPLARGGRHAIGNLLPSCGRCNNSKGSRLLIEWKTLSRRLTIRSTAIADAG
jgi:5-methylcytosine-specific restriction endonuclease McrA